MAKKIDWSIDGQIDMFSYLADMPTKKQKEEAANVLAAPISFSERKKAILDSAEEYLKKGERLTSLAKDRFGIMLERLSFSATEEKLFSINVPVYSLSSHLVPKIATTVVRPLLKKLTTCDKEDKALEILKSLIDYDIELEKISDGFSRCSATHMLARKSRELLKFTLKEEGWKPLSCYGLQMNAHTGKKKNLLYKDGSMQGDIAEALAWLICLTQYNRAIVNEELIPGIEKKVEKINKGVDSLVLLKNVICNDTTTGRITTWRSDYNDIRELYEAKRAPFVIPKQKYVRPSDDAVEELFKILGVDERALLDSNEASSVMKMQQRNILDVQGEYKSPYAYILTTNLDLAFYAIDPVNWAKHGHKVSYHSFLETLHKDEYDMSDEEDREPKLWAVPHWYDYTPGNFRSIVEGVLEIVFDNYREKVETLKYIKETKSRAKVYQTKKNIPDKVIKQMQESIFNDYFGYVELDSDTDNEKVQAIADEFIAFKETYLKGFDSSKISIRFRKLGNHKAAGLYFPHIGCLCVDFRYPDSLVHEYGHCIDYLMAKATTLSDEPEFFNVQYEYKEAFLDALRASGKSLSGKYDKKYFMQKTEIFARCFEMYVTRTLGMQNSICKPDSDTSFAYPQSERLMHHIDDYFEKLFSMLNADEAEEKVA